MINKKHGEKVIGQIFIREFNIVYDKNIRLNEEYLQTRKQNEFPDLKFIDDITKEELSAEVVSTPSEEIEKKKNDLDDPSLIEVDLATDLFDRLKKKDKKYGLIEKQGLILLVELPWYFYTDKHTLKLFSKKVKEAAFSFKEIWALWPEETKTKKPFKLA